MIQVGVVGSSQDISYPKETEKYAMRIGELIAERKAALLFGSSGKKNSLSLEAAKGAKRKGGFVVAFTRDDEKVILGKEFVDILIPTGMSYGGREYVFIRSCDGVVGLHGGVGTLQEFTLCYMLKKPLVVLEQSGGWSSKLAGEYLDERRWIRVEASKTPEEIVEKVFHLIRINSGT